MSTLLVVLAVVAVAWGLAYHRAPLYVWIAAAAATLGAWTVLDASARGAQVASWVVFLVIALPLAVRPLRRRWLSAPVFALFRRALPSISATEREALEAGTVGWEAELFRGAPRWSRFLRATPARLSDEERAFLDGPTETLCRMVDDWRVTAIDHDLPPEVWRYMKEQGFFGMIIPKAYGGLEFSAFAHSQVVARLATRSLVAAVTVMVPNSLGPAKLLLEYGTPEQRNHYLPRLARGDDVPCFALTGPEAGSDAAAMPDTGVVCEGEIGGERVTGIRLNWDKRYITLGPVATVLGLAFRLRDPEHRLGDAEDLGITLALIPTDTPGVEIGRRHDPLDIPFQNGPNRGRDVFIPLEWIIGGRERIAQGWRMLMECLAAGRGISLPALSTGAGQLASRTTGAYARVRRQFDRPIGHFEGVQEALARIGGHTYAIDAARRCIAAAIDRGEHPAVASAILKYHSTERMRALLNDAMDVHGGKGICLGPRNYLGRAYQAVPISITVEGANILTRNLMIFGQGALRCHPYLLEEVEAAADPDARAGLRRFDRAFFAHGGYLIGSVARAVFLGLTSARLARRHVPGAAGRHVQRITRMSAALALAAEVALIVVGGALKRRERLSARLGDALSALYIASATVRRYRDDGRPAADEPFLHWACEDALHRSQQALDEFLRNFPVRPVAWILRAACFPWGRPFRPPADHLDTRAADALTEPGATRDRLTEGMHIPDDPREALRELEDALARSVAAEPVERKVREALKRGALAPTDDEQALLTRAIDAEVIDAEEAERVRAARAARIRVIQVDDFPPNDSHGDAAWHSAHARGPAPDAAAPSTS